MPVNHTQPRYAPSSVGGLMDPAFLRGAMSDANGGHRPMAAATGIDAAAAWPRLRQAVLAAVRWRVGGRRTPQ